MNMDTGRDVMTNRWCPIVILIAFAVFLHAMDRGSLSMASVAIKSELHLSSAAIGVLMSAFFWTYVPGQFAAAWAMRRFGAFYTLVAGLSLWSVATAGMSLASGMAGLLALRLFVGFAEAATFPTTSKLIATHVPPARFGLANASINAGLMLGNAVSSLLSGILLLTIGWRAMFVVFGLLSLIWLTCARSVRPADFVTLEPLPRGNSFRWAISCRELWATAAGQFTINYPYFLLVTWLPLYLVQRQGFSTIAMSLVVGTFFVLSAAMGLASGWVADFLIRSGRTLTAVRKGMILVSGVWGVFCMGLCATGDGELAIAGVLLSSVTSGLAGASVFAIGQTLAGSRAAGEWAAIQTAFGSLSGVAASIITGVIVDKTGDFRAAFLFAGGVMSAGLVIWKFGIRKVECIAPAELQ